MKAIFEFEDSLYLEFKKVCKEKGHSMTWVLTEFMKNFIAARGAGK